MDEYDNFQCGECANGKNGPPFECYVHPELKYYLYSINTACADFKLKSNKKPYEHFICQQCYRGIDHEGYYSCELDSTKQLSFNSVACSGFNPRSNIKTEYKLYLLEERVHELEHTVIELRGRLC